MIDPRAAIAGGFDARRLHRAEVIAQRTKPPGRRKSHQAETDRINCLIAAEVGHQLRLIQVDTRIALGLLVSEALREVLARPDAADWFRDHCRKMPEAL